MKVAFLNCTDELNPEAGSELTCVFLDKIPGTLEFCKRLKLKDPNLYFDAYVHNGQHVNASYGRVSEGRRSCNGRGVYAAAQRTVRCRLRQKQHRSMPGFQILM